MNRIPERNWQPPSPESLETATGFMWEGEYILCHPYNTYLRSYGQGNGRFDYFAVATQDEPRYFPLHYKELSDIKEQLIAKGFPHYYDAIPDDTAYAVFKHFIFQGLGIQQR